MTRIFSIVILAGILIISNACVAAQASPQEGQNLAVIKGCSACHAVDATPKIGPSWVGLYGSQVELADGNFVTADESYLIESINEPNAKIVKGYSKGAMPQIALTEEELNAIVAYIKNVE